LHFHQLYCRYEAKVRRNYALFFPALNGEACRALGQKDLDPSKLVRRVYVTCDMEAVHPDDLGRYLPSDCDFGWVLIGNDCARILGMEWTLPEIVA
jgi:hypothetical protein